MLYVANEFRTPCLKRSLKMILSAFYVNESPERAGKVTELQLDELEQLVGRFNKVSIRAGQLRGEVVEYIDGAVIIRHHFTKKKLWSKE